MLKLSLSYDHRLIDGALAQRALNKLNDLLHDPQLLLMEGWDPHMSDVEKRDTVIIGAGPGGYVAAIRAAELGKAWQ